MQQQQQLQQNFHFIRKHQKRIRKALRKTCSSLWFGKVPSGVTIFLRRLIGLELMNQPPLPVFSHHCRWRLLSLVLVLPLTRCRFLYVRSVFFAGVYRIKSSIRIFLGELELFFERKNICERQFCYFVGNTGQCGARVHTRPFAINRSAKHAC